MIERTDYVETESQNLLQRLFGGELSPLVAHFVGSGKLSPQDARRLKGLIEKLKDD